MRGPGKTEVAWQDAQRKRLNAALQGRRVRSLSDIMADAKRTSQAGWSNTHEKEVNFQSGNRLKRKMDSYLQGNLLANETSADFKAVAVEYTRWRDAEDDKIARKRLRTELADQPAEDLDLRGSKVFVDESLSGDPGIRRAAARLNITITDARKDAGSFVVKDPSDPGQRTTWTAMMSGGNLITKEALTSNCATGCFVRVQSATCSVRTLWMSPRFITAHPIIADIVRDACAKPTCKWKILGTRALFEAARARVAGNAHKAMSVIALCLPSEKSGDQAHRPGLKRKGAGYVGFIERPKAVAIFIQFSVHLTFYITSSSFRFPCLHMYTGVYYLGRFLGPSRQ